MELKQQTSQDAVMIEMPSPGVLAATLNRPDANNSLCHNTITQLHEFCDRVEADSSICLVTLSALGQMFSSGMDFQTADEHEDHATDNPRGFADLLHRLSMLPATSVANVQQSVFAGGVGLAAACDVVIAHPRVQFRLTEALWGLQPANIAPYLIRRMGFQHAYRMALTTSPIQAAQAERYGLVDIVAEDASAAMRELRLQTQRISRRTRVQMKRMFQSFWLLDAKMRSAADSEMRRTIADPLVQKNLRRYRQMGLFPWEAEQ